MHYWPYYVTFSAVCSFALKLKLLRLIFGSLLEILHEKKINKWKNFEKTTITTPTPTGILELVYCCSCILSKLSKCRICKAHLQKRTKASVSKITNSSHVVLWRIQSGVTIYCLHRRYTHTVGFYWSPQLLSSHWMVYTLWLLCLSCCGIYRLVSCIKGAEFFSVLFPL